MPEPTIQWIVPPEYLGMFLYKWRFYNPPIPFLRREKEIMKLLLKDAIRWLEIGEIRVLQILTIKEQLNQESQGVQEYIWEDVPTVTLGDSLLPPSIKKE